MDSDPVYLDENATTRLDPRVLEAMEPFLRGPAGNSSSRHAFGRDARRAIETAREQIAGNLGAEPDELIFTSGATEANNIAIAGSPLAPGAAVLVNPAEHPSALEPTRHLADRGVVVREFALDSGGAIRDPSSSINEEIRLAVVQLANSETGVIQDVAGLARLLPSACHLHCDAVQALGKFPLNVAELGASSLAISAHKIHGPAGIGALILRKPRRIEPMFFGGGQEQGLRPGTLPVALVVGFAKAVQLAVRGLHNAAENMTLLRDRFETALCQAVPGTTVNGGRARRLCNTTNLHFPGVNAEALVIALDLAGICCSLGTACASGAVEPSPTLLAMGLDRERAASGVRFSISRMTTNGDISMAVNRVVAAVATLRSRSPTFPLEAPRPLLE